MNIIANDNGQKKSYSVHIERESVYAERFIRSLKNKITST